MKTPSFWYKSHSLLSRISYPLEELYDALRLKNFADRQKSGTIPVLSVGNITMGGSGKTPVTIMLLGLIKQHNIALSPHIITRGYGGNMIGPELITTETPPHICGDEALLLTKHAPTIIARNRFDGAYYAAAVGADMAILDDGLQNKHLKPTLSFCVIDGAHGFGNGHLFPSGPLREPLAEAFKRIDAVFIIGDDKKNIKSSIPPQTPVFNAHIIADTRHINKTLKYIAFCGIGLPEKFLTTLKDNEINITSHEFFADHYPYTQMDIDRLINTAKNLGARLITTEKDFIKIKSLTNDASLIDVLPITIACDETESLIQFLKDRITIA